MGPRHCSARQSRRRCPGHFRQWAQVHLRLRGLPGWPGSLPYDRTQWLPHARRAYVALGSARGDVTHFDATTAGHDSFVAMSAGAYWTHFGPTGWYLDGVLQGTWYDVRGASNYLSPFETEGLGMAASIEGGLPL
ncbi:MAG: autotransporter outer membrane beta-barrel domain-containing protein, partial [Rhodospirillales bacterium]|nr:autotransporter outer membrane beta-barrel domain-containing protein [Rhodospirillales bacterium]